MTNSNKYIIITGAHNEASNIERTILSVIKQTLLPAEWIIIDDGSTDNTVNIIEKYSTDFTNIKIFKEVKSNAEFGTHAVVNFNKGLSYITETDYSYVIKLDADLDIDDVDFFERQVQEMKNDPKLGICSGITYSEKNGIKVLTKGRPQWRTGGAMKFYRRACLESFGGLDAMFGWDGIDDYKAMYRGWTTKTFYDLHVNHLGKERALTREKNEWKAAAKAKSLYKRGYPIEFILLKSISFYKKSYAMGNSFMKGFFYSRKHNEPLVVTNEEKKFIRKFQYKRLFNKFIK